MRFTEHRQFYFHAENVTKKKKAKEIVKIILQDLGLFVMTSPYIGAWGENATKGYIFTWIAPCTWEASNSAWLTDEQENVLMNLEALLCELTGNRCLMSKSQVVGISCKCDS